MKLYDGRGNTIELSPESVTPGVGMGEISANTVMEENNLFAVYPFKEGYYLRNGEEKENVNYAVSDYIPCGVGESIRFEFATKNLKPAVVFYDANKTFLSSVECAYSVVGEPQTITTPENTAYIRFSLSKGIVTDKSASAYLTQEVTYYSLVDTAQKRWQENIDAATRDSRLSGIDALIYNYTKWKGKSLVTDGNSLVAASSWGDKLAEFLRMSHTNLGNSGSMITPVGDTTDTIKANVANNYPDAVDLVMLQGDTNGAMDGNPSDQMDGDNPQTTWTARMNYLIRCIRAKYHNVVIVLMPDSVRYDGGVEAYSLEKNRTSYTAMKALAEYNRLAFFAFDHSTPYNPNHEDNYYSRYLHEHDRFGVAQDMVHPYATYSDEKGYALAHFVAGLVFDPDAPNTAATDWQSSV